MPLPYTKTPKTHRDSPEWRLSELRSLLHRPPCPLVWAEICAVLAPAAHDDHLWETLIPYAEEHLKAWPDAMRVNPAAWMRATLRGERCRLWRLARHLRHHGPLGDHGLLVVMSDPDMGSLTDITLRSCDLSAESGATFEKHLKNHPIRSITLDHNPLGKRILHILVDIQPEVVSIESCEVHPILLAHLNSSPMSDKLKKLNLKNNHIKFSTIHTQNTKKLEKLNIQGNTIDIKSIARHLPQRMPLLQKIEMSGLDVRERSVRAELEHLHAQMPELVVWVDDERWEP